MSLSFKCLRERIAAGLTGLVSAADTMEELEECREVMRSRAADMYKLLGLKPDAFS